MIDQLVTDRHHDARMARKQSAAHARRQELQLEELSHADQIVFTDPETEEERAREIRRGRDLGKVEFSCRRGPTCVRVSHLSDANVVYSKEARAWFCSEDCREWYLANRYG